MVRLLNDFDPHVMIDLHTTNGSRHAYHLTYETPNNPAVDRRHRRSRRASGWPRCRKAIKSKDGWDFRVLRQRVGHGPRPGLDHRRGSAALHPQLLGDAQPLRHPERDLLVSAVRRSRRHQPALPRRGAGLRARQRRGAEEDGRRLPTPRSLVGQRLSLRSKVARGAAPVEILMGGVEEEVNPYSGRMMHKRTERADARADGGRNDVRLHRPGAGARPRTSCRPSRRPRSNCCAPTASRWSGSPRPRRCRSRSSPSPNRRRTPKPFENHQERTVTGAYGRGRARGAGRRLPRGDDAARWRGWPSTCSSRARTTAW